MQKGLGITAIIISVLAIFVPIAGPWMTLLSGSLAAAAYGPGFALGIAAVFVSLLNIWFLSPTIWLNSALGAAASANEQTWFSAGTWLTIFQLAAISVLVFLNSRNR